MRVIFVVGCRTLLTFALTASVIAYSLLAQSDPTTARAVNLLEAVESALANHPAARIQEQQIEVKRGLHQQATGVFDQMIIGGLNHDRLYPPFTAAERLSRGPTSPDGAYSDVTSLEF